MAYKSGLNTFLTTAKYSSVAELNDLDSEYTGELGSWMYFKFPVEYPSESRIEITASGNGKLAMFISPTVYYPSEEEHTWSSGIAEWKHFLGNLEDYCVDIDPFDKFMPKEYTRKPTAKDLKRLDVEESEEQNENTLVRFCNDTDD